MCVVSDDVTSECNGSAFVTSQHFLCLLLLNLIQFTTPDSMLKVDKVNGLK